MSIAKRYCSNSATKQRAHWSLKTGACYLVILHINQKKLPPGLFFKVQMLVFIVDGIACYGLEDVFDESILRLF